MGLPAAFGRLCVETIWSLRFSMTKRPAAFGRLCVETKAWFNRGVTSMVPAAFGRLCVETGCGDCAWLHFRPSRLRAAVC